MQAMGQAVCRKRVDGASPSISGLQINDFHMLRKKPPHHQLSRACRMRGKGRAHVDEFLSISAFRSAFKGDEQRNWPSGDACPRKLPGSCRSSAAGHLTC